MRVFLCLFLCLSGLFPSFALGKLVQPDGSVTAVGQQTTLGSQTILFPPEAIPVRSWLLLPPRTTVVDAEVFSRGERHLVSFPVVRIPGVRFALEVPARTLSVTLRGQIPTILDLVRSAEPPPLGRQAWVVRSFSDLRVDLPAWKTAPGWTPYLELNRPINSPWQAILSDGTKSRSFAFLSSVRHWGFAPQAWGIQPTSLTIHGVDPRLSLVDVRAVKATAPLPADPPTLLNWPRTAWRNPQREWFQWTGTSVLVLVTGDYRIQDAYLKRLAFYVEKTGYRGRLVTDDEVSALHAWNAHDYAAPDLARFFTQAARESFPLNDSEIELRERLVASGILVAEGKAAWKEGTGALVGISAESGTELRKVLFVHESFHGLYFTTPEFRAGVKAAWEGISAPARAAFRSYLSKSRYDPADEGLMVNEFQAYVLQRPAAEWEGFFRDRVLEGQPSRKVPLDWMVDFLSAARQLDALIHSLYGFSSGNDSLVTTF